jgi:hypothetical protein
MCTLSWRDAASRGEGRERKGGSQDRTRNLFAVDYVLGLDEKKKPEAAEEARDEPHGRVRPLRSRVPAEPPQQHLVRLGAVRHETENVAKQAKQTFKRKA